MASGFKIDKQGIRKMVREIEREFAKTPVRLPVNGEPTASGSVGGRATTGSELELVAGWLLDWGYAYSKVKPGLVPSVAEMMSDVGAEEFVPLVEPYVEVAVATLEEAGLFNGSARTFGSDGMGLPVWLTDVGQREAVSRIERRKDNLTRRSACRDAVLRWVYERGANGESTDIAEIATSPYGWFNGMLFSAADLVEAVQFLRNRRLLAGTDETPTIEPAGTECIEQYGGVVEYLNRANNAGVNVTIMGNNSGQLAVANRDVAQNQTSTNQAEALAIYANALREFGQLLPSEQQPEYEEVAQALEREATKTEPNKGWVKALLDRAKGLLEGAPANLHNLAQVTKVAFDIYSQTAG
ncbi:hypothetical protein AB0J86_12980 [Micromonospora sp. NPDC049559]|uniref:hypothetical protein n=1 Tax=Micromonospora sp. NPDC049559 TaxID=3155923 RepID=UPI003436F7A6